MLPTTTTRTTLEHRRALRLPSALAFVLSTIAATACLVTLSLPPRRPPVLHNFGTNYGVRNLPWEKQNEQRIAALNDCLRTKSCLPRQQQVVVLAGWHFSDATTGAVSGENIWANSVMDSLEALGYTYLFTGKNRGDIAPIYKKFPDHVIAVISFAAWITECMGDRGCIKSAHNQDGVPLWKFLAFEFWAAPNHPLGGDWTLSPENYEIGTTYLGYSVERSCLALPYKAHTDRPNRALVLAKRLTYMYRPSYPWADINYAHPPDYVSLGEGFQFVGAIKDDTHDQLDHDVTLPPNPHIPEGIHSLTNGKNLDRSRWYAELADSRVMVGIGQPYLSPSPWDALCLGVPFINPIERWDPANPNNRSSWLTQHNGLRYEEEPRVYHIFESKDPETRVRDFWTTLERALKTPLERYIPEHRTPKAVRERLQHILETDWKTKAKVLRNHRKANGEEIADFVL